MRAMLTFGSLLIVLAVIAVSVRSQLQANKRFLPASAASDAASGALSGSAQNQASQYQRQLDAAMKAGAQHTADQAASAGEDATR
jgi:septal ring-binding cell division protein DamX